MQRITYKPFGELYRIEGQNQANFYYNSKELDETGLYYYGARYYDSQIARFTQPDTIIQAPYDPQSLNRYTYCRNNPVNLIDPTGNFWWVIGAAIGALIGGLSAHFTGGNIWQGIGLGALTGGLSFGTIASSAPALLKLSSGLGFISFVSSRIPEPAFQDIAQYTGYASLACAGIYTAWQIGVGIKDWLMGRGAYYDVKSGKEITEAEILNRYGKGGAIPKIAVNGITQELDEALAFAGKEKVGANILFYNPTHGAIADLTESVLAYLTGTSSLSRQLGALLTKIPASVIGYSQGTIITSNALLYAGLHGGVPEGTALKVYASAIGRMRLALIRRISGAKIPSFVIHSFDPIKLTSSEIWAPGYIEGSIGLFGMFFGWDNHTNYW